MLIIELLVQYYSKPRQQGTNIHDCESTESASIQDEDLLLSCEDVKHCKRGIKKYICAENMAQALIYMSLCILQ